MSDLRIPVGAWAEEAIDWLTGALGGLFRLISTVLRWLYDLAEQIFTSPDVWWVGLVLSLVVAGAVLLAKDWRWAAGTLAALLAYWVVTQQLVPEPDFWFVAVVLALVALVVKGWLLAVAAALGFVLIFAMNQWDNAVQTIALVLVASAIATLLAIPTGILAARSSVASAIVRPVLDFLQTMPAFVYLIPAIMLFRTGVVPGIIASIVFAMAPGVRFTELGIRQVDREVVEAGHAFGATPRRILRQIQLPLAMPTIMAGINQIIMLSLSMVVIAAMVGAPGLGQDVVTGLTGLRVGLGVEAGLAVVILAIYLDRVTAALGDRSPVARAQKIRASDD
ncbi:ABC transporter permease subunit [uncultured Georgenia sp.]|uniref:ABC transporter permease n=1 Tax=uncultured Georgenia sp. TaxID=378209 RepID=UPI002614F95D|nr:ABC transporter permease subunit [uncultured Georgenia sp.]HLV05643.1 ABC transporter permease subunit [Actinomycetaceae bacterium]